MEANRRRERAKALALSDMRLLSELVDLRRSRGLTQAQVAEALGVSQQAVSAFEQLQADPRMSTVRQYAHAVGALIGHEVRLDSGAPGDLEWLDSRHTIKSGGHQPGAITVVVKREAVETARSQFALSP